MDGPCGDTTRRGFSAEFLPDKVRATQAPPVRPLLGAVFPRRYRKLANASPVPVSAGVR